MSKLTLTLDPRKLAIGAFAAVLAVALTFLALYLSAAAFLAANKTNPMRAHWDSLPRYWSAYGSDPAQQRRLIGATVLAFGLCYVAVPLLLVMGARRRPELFGSARFANAMEVRRYGLLSGKGLILGKHNGRILTFPGQQYVLVSAPPRSYKGASVAVPNLLNWDGSAVVLDVKGELKDITSGWRAKHGQKVFVFAPFNKQGCTHRYNPLGYVSTDRRLRVGDLLKLSQIIYPSDSGKAGNDNANFWADQARNLFLAFGLYLLETPESEMPRTIGQMLRMASGNGEPMTQYLAGLVARREAEKRALSDECVQAFNRVLSNSENTFANIISSFNAPLTRFSDPVTDAATSANDFDLRDLRKQRMTVYLCMPFDELDGARLLLNLFLTQAIHANVQELPAQNPALKHQCLLLLDEVTTAGRLDVLAKGIGFMPGYNMRLLIIVQSLSQLAGTYGREWAQAITTSCACKVLFAANELSDAEANSKALGTYTMRITNRSHGSSSGRGGGSSSSNTSESVHARALVMPQEFMELGEMRAIIKIEGRKPIDAEKLPYFMEPALQARVIDAVFVEPIDMGLHQARTEQRHRPATAEDGDIRDIPMERIAADFSDLPAPSADTDVEKVDAWMGDFFARMAPPAAEVPPAELAPPALEKPAKPEGSAVGIDVKVGRDGVVHVTPKVVRKRKPKPTEDEAEDGMPRTLVGREQDIETDADGVIHFKNKSTPRAEAPPEGEEEGGTVQEFDLSVLNANARRPSPGREH